jgi:hypothetical protein
VNAGVSNDANRSDETHIVGMFALADESGEQLVAQVFDRRAHKAGCLARKTFESGAEVLAASFDQSVRVTQQRGPRRQRVDSFDACLRRRGDGEWPGPRTFEKTRFTVRLDDEWRGMAGTRIRHRA